MCTVHANYIKGNVAKMLRLNENGLWLAVPSEVAYRPDYSSAIIEKSNNTIDDMVSGQRYNLQQVILSHTVWGKCNEYHQY